MRLEVALLAVCSSLWLQQQALGIPLQDFYPFGIGTGDLSLEPGDDLALEVALSSPFPFFGTSYASLFVSAVLCSRFVCMINSKELAS